MVNDDYEPSYCMISKSLTYNKNTISPSFSCSFQRWIICPLLCQSTSSAPPPVLHSTHQAGLTHLVSLAVFLSQTTDLAYFDFHSSALQCIPPPTQGLSHQLPSLTTVLSVNISPWSLLPVPVDLSITTADKKGIRTNL